MKSSTLIQFRAMLRLCFAVTLIVCAAETLGQTSTRKTPYPHDAIKFYDESELAYLQKEGRVLRDICMTVKDIQLPLSSRKKTSRRQNHCQSSSDMYYDLLADKGEQATKSDWLKIHACAVDDKDDYVLMMLYANGYGVKPNLSVALKYACTATWAAAELAGRVKFFAESISTSGSNKAVGFDMCDHTTSGMMDGVCASNGARQQERIRSKKITAFVLKLPVKQRPSFMTLQTEVEKFAEATSMHETDVSGTARAMLAINAKEDVLQQWISDLESLESNKFSTTAQTSLSEINAGMAKLLAEIAAITSEEDQLTEESKLKIKSGQFDHRIGYTTIHVSDVLKAQKDWESFKAAWLSFAKERYPKLTVSDLYVELSARRNMQLEALLSMNW